MRYIVWSPTGPTNPRQTHETRAEAKRIAEDMARKHPPNAFFACALTDSYRKSDIQHTDLTAPGADTDDDIPF